MNLLTLLTDQKIVFVCFSKLHLKDKSFFINYHNF